MKNKKIEDAFNKMIIDNLPEDKLKEFEILLKVGDKERLNAFIRTILPDIEKMIAKNMKNLF